MRSPFGVVVMISLWLAVVCNLPLWRELLDLPGAGTTRGWFFTGMFALVVAGGNAALLTLLAWRWTLRPVATLLVLMAAFGAYFMLAYGIAIDASMLVNVFQTDVKEAGDLLNLRMAGTVLALSAPALIWLYRAPVRFATPARQLLHNLGLFTGSVVLVVLCIVLVFQDFASTMRNHTRLRYLINPLNSVYALGMVATRPLRMDTRTLLPLGEDAKLGPSYDQQGKPPLLVLVVGETGRSGNFGLNGYERDTTPLLSARKDLISGRNAWSCGTSTAASLPCMFSHLGRAGFESRKVNHENLVDVLKRAGLAVMWVDNQAGCKGLCDRVEQVRTTDQTDPQWCSSGECLDGIMASRLDGYLSALPAEQRARGAVLVLHQMGSHGPAYFKRSAPERKAFTPECTSTALQECNRQEVVNAYDNSIRETDFFLDATLQWLGRQETHYQTAMMYVSDHGESLGENNLYLHGLPYAIAPDVQKHVPWITWLSASMQTRRHTSQACLQKDLTQRQISHDSYFHTVLGLMDVQTAVYQSELDLLTPCRK